MRSDEKRRDAQVCRYKSLLFFVSAVSSAAGTHQHQDNLIDYTRFL